MIPFPEQASTIAGQIDLVFVVLIILSLLFSVGVAGIIIFFSIKYREGSPANRENAPTGNIPLEIFWSVGPLILGILVFIWAATLYIQKSTPPPDATDIYVIAKQWMWQTQHPDGQREIDSLHVPVNRPIQLVMISQDVIHSFWVPDFRIKQDVLPGRYTTLWFEATKPGIYPLKCAEYCGTEHSGMIGEIIVMEQSEYQQWLTGETPEQTLEERGGQLFEQLGCQQCHQDDGSGSGPSLAGVFRSTVELESGGTITADESYLRRSILEPQAHIVAGYEPIMPTYEGRVSESELVALVNYIKSLG